MKDPVSRVMFFFMTHFVVPILMAYYLSTSWMRAKGVLP